jgi:hypothetical protein
MAKNWIRSKRVLQILKGRIFSVGPDERDIFTSQAMKGKTNGRIMISETAIKIAKTKKDLNIMSRMRNRPLSYGGELLWIHLDAISTNQIPEIFNFGLVELALLGVGEEAHVLQAVENELDLLIMFLLSSRKDQYIIQVNNTKDTDKIT